LAEVGDTAQAYNRFCLLAQVGGNTAQAPTASIYWLKSATLRKRRPLLFIG
jgi:hypothetical protein